MTTSDQFSFKLPSFEGDDFTLSFQTTSDATEGKVTIAGRHYKVIGDEKTCEKYSTWIAQLSMPKLEFESIEAFENALKKEFRLSGTEQESSGTAEKARGAVLECFHAL